MKIRSITLFCDPGWPLDEQALEQAAHFITAARRSFHEAGYEVQTARLATPPFPSLVSDPKSDIFIHMARSLENHPLLVEFDYFALGPALPEQPWSYAVIPQVIAATQKIFLSGLMTAGENLVSLPAVRACAQVIARVAGISNDGFANLRFAALANVSPGSPFFPSAYHAGGGAQFALAMEAADLAVEAVQGASSLERARQKLIEKIELNAAELEQISRSLADQFRIPFAGFDFTLAPFPQPAQSFGSAMELLGLSRIGQHGSLAAAAFLTDTLDQSNFARAGFNGLMLPVLEDAVLAKRAEQGVLTLKDLLMYAAVCGTGLDTVPLPGDTSAAQLAGLLLDVAALAQRLKKPLSARLMPIPGKKAGDPTGFDFSYFANSRVMAIEASPLDGLLASDEVFSLSPRSPA